MKYKVEAYKNRKLILDEFLIASTPSQIVRNVMNRTKYDDYQLFILNSKGEVWIYYIKYNTATVIDKNTIINKMVLSNIMSGNASIGG